MRKMKGKYTLYLSLTVAFLLFLAVLIFLVFREGFSRNPFIAEHLGLPIPVYVSPVTGDSTKRFVGANAVTEPSKVVAVSFPSLETGTQLRIVDLLVKVSDRVKKGQTLATIENVSLSVEAEKLKDSLPVSRSKYNIARANLEEKRSYFNSIDELYSKGFATKSELETARDALVKAEMDLRVYEQDIISTESLVNRFSSSMGELKIKSPIEGVVLEKEVEEGEVRSVGDTILSIGEITPLYAVADVAQEDKSVIRIGQKAEISFNYLPGINYTGTVTRIEPKVDVQTQTFDVWISIPNQDKQLLPGSAAFARFKAGEEVVVVPRLAVVGMPEDPGVFVVGDDNRAYLRRVVLGMAFAPNKFEVLKGLKEGERVVTFNIKYLDDGYPVSILNGKGNK